MVITLMYAQYLYQPILLLCNNLPSRTYMYTKLTVSYILFVQISEHSQTITNVTCILINVWHYAHVLLFSLEYCNYTTEELLVRHMMAIPTSVL